MVYNVRQKLEVKEKGTLFGDESLLITCQIVPLASAKTNQISKIVSLCYQIVTFSDSRPAHYYISVTLNS